MSNMHKTQTEKKEEDSDEEDDDDDNDDDDDKEEAQSKTPHLECARIKHQGCVNRIRVSI
jgi:ribosome assembly protein RRB1